MTSWRDAFAIYRDRRMLAILCMGFSSGLPLLLTFSTLTFWLSASQVSRKEVGLFVLVGLSYSFKFLWSPVIDQISIPVLTRRMGRRRSWAIVIQLPLMAAIFALGSTDPGTDVFTTAVLAVIVAFLSASQDIVIDAYRVELLKPEEQGAGAAATQWGYRIGLLAAGTGAFDIAAFAGWHVAYQVMAALMLVGIFAVLLTREPYLSESSLLPEADQRQTRSERLVAWARHAIILPFADFMRRRGWITILILIVLYKLGEAIAGSMAIRLYWELGFTEVEVGNIGKISGFVATLAGVAAGGAMVARLGVMRALFYGGVLQMLSNLLYIALLSAGHSNLMLAASIFGENFTGGMASAAFVAYLSGLCSAGFTATQYALFSSLAAVPLRFLSAPSGWLVDRLDWALFFLMATAICLPSLILLLWMKDHFEPDDLPRAPAIAR